MNNVSTPYNAHTHNDLTKTTANTFTIGNSLTGDKSLAISNNFTTGPSIRYRQTTERWQATNDASTFFDIPLVSNTTAGQLIRATGSAWAASTPTFPNTGGTAGQWLRTDGTNYGLSTPTIPNAITQGDILYGSAANVLTALGAGTSGQFLKTQGAGANPVWAAAGGGAATGRVVRTAGNVTTTSTTYVDLTGATVTATTTARPVLIGQVCACSNDTGTSNSDYFTIDIDGTKEFGTEGLQVIIDSTSNAHNCSLTHLSAALTAASHTIKIQWRTNANTATVYANGTIATHAFWIAEQL